MHLQMKRSSFIFFVICFVSASLGDNSTQPTTTPTTTATTKPKSDTTTTITTTPIAIYNAASISIPEFGYSAYCQPCITPCEVDKEKKKYMCHTKEWTFENKIYDWDYCSTDPKVDFQGSNCSNDCSLNGEQYNWCTSGSSWGYCSSSTCSSSIDELTMTETTGSGPTTTTKTTTIKVNVNDDTGNSKSDGSRKMEIEVEEEENVAADLSVLLPSNYVPYQLPVVDNKQFVPVFVSLFISTVADINEQDGKLTLDTHFSRRWLDYKISKRFTGPMKNVTLGPEALEKIWKPDLYFDGTPAVEKDTSDTTEKALRVLFKTNDLLDAQIAFSERVRLKLDCEMDFHYYPADTQVCTYQLRSFSYKESRLKLFWETPNSVFLREISHPNFDLMVEAVYPNIKENGTHKLYVEETFNPFRRGNYSALTFTVKARRKLEYHLVQTYLPSMLLICMTWLCFLLPASMVEARIGISMTTVLTLTAMFASVRQLAPSVSYTMAIDIWMVFCIFVVFTSLLLFIFVYWLENKSKKHSDSQENLNLEFTNRNKPPEKYKYHLLLKFSQYYSFALFAVIFSLFVLGYWLWLIFSSRYFTWEVKPDYNGVDDGDSTEGGVNYYRYLIEDSVKLFDSDVYPPKAREVLRKVFALV